MDNDLPLSQFVDNSWTSDYLMNDTTLIFSPGNYSLESELVVENIHSFSMFAWTGSSSKAVITCSCNARFEFRNISTVTVSGLEFVGCFESLLVSVGKFQLENSGFIGNGQAIVNGEVLIVSKTAAKIYYSKFIQSIGDATVLANDSNLIIIHSTFTNNTGFVLDLWHSNVSLSHCEFFSNKGYTTVFVNSGTITSIDCSRFINNTGLRVLHAQNTSVSVSHSEFNSNKILSTSELIARAVPEMHAMPTGIDFINNNEFYILCVANANMASIANSQ